MENIDALWDEVLAQMEKKVSKPSYETWLKSTKASSLQGDTLTITAPNEFARDWLEGRYTHLISSVLYEVVGEELLVKFIIPQNQKNSDVDDQFPADKKKKKRDDESNEYPQHMLNNKNTFDTFVIGSGNRFAHAASLAVAEAPAKAYNPLFIYGGVGLGKTHLMYLNIIHLQK